MAGVAIAHAAIQDLPGRRLGDQILLLSDGGAGNEAARIYYDTPGRRGRVAAKTVALSARFRFVFFHACGRPAQAADVTLTQRATRPIDLRSNKRRFGA